MVRRLTPTDIGCVCFIDISLEQFELMAYVIRETGISLKYYTARQLKRLLYKTTATRIIIVRRNTQLYIYIFVIN